MTRAPQRLGYGTFDGFVALAILVLGLGPLSPWHYSIAELSALTVRLPDAIFAVLYMLAWRYCFTLLNLYDKFATVPSRMGAILKGVLIMMVPAVAYYRVEHPEALALRRLGMTALTLFLYEMNRSAFNVHLLDRLAARDPRRAVIVGSGRRASKAWRVVRTRYRLSLRLLGFVDDRSVDDMPPDIARRYLGCVEDLDKLILNQVVDLILIAMPIRSCYPLMQHAIDLAEDAGVQVMYLDDIYSSRKQTSDTGSYIFRELAADQEHYLAFLLTKRLLDVLGSFLGLLLLSPLLASVALAIKLTTKGPAIIKLERYGYHRRRFYMLKFRSSVDGLHKRPSNDDRIGQATAPTLDSSSQPAFTRLGRLLRRTAFDELPQLWNVLVGDMSWVGPRPMSVEDMSLFDSAALTRRFSVRPGITGLWQVSRVPTNGFSQWVAIDNRYIDKRSLSADAMILAQTIKTVIRGTGAI